MQLQLKADKASVFSSQMSLPWKKSSFMHLVQSSEDAFSFFVHGTQFLFVAEETLISNCSASSTKITNDFCSTI